MSSAQCDLATGGAGTGIDVGSLLRVIREPYFGLLGKVAGLPPELLHEARDVVALSLSDTSREERTDEGLLKAKIHAGLRTFLRKRTQKRPLIIPVIVEL